MVSDEQAGRSTVPIATSHRACEPSDAAAGCLSSADGLALGGHAARGPWGVYGVLTYSYPRLAA